MVGKVEITPVSALFQKSTYELFPPSLAPAPRPSASYGKVTPDSSMTFA
jgi:hypothetical protein